MVTPVTLVKSVPVKVTVWPIVAVLGATVVITGEGVTVGGSTVNDCELVPVPPEVMTEIGPVVAPSGT